MFEIFDSHLSSRDFSQYFSNAIFRITDPIRDHFRAVIGTQQAESAVAGMLLHADGGRANITLFSDNTSRNCFSDNTGDLYRNVDIRPLMQNLGAFDFPTLGYFSMGPGYLYRAVVSPSDTARRGFCTSRVGIEMNRDSEGIAEDVSASGDVYPNLARAFIALHSSDRFTPWATGIKQMQAGKIVGFTPNRNTGVVLNTAPSAEQFPIRVWYRGQAVGRVDTDGQLHLISSKINNEYLVTRKERTA